MSDWSVDHLGNNVTIITFRGVGSGWRQRVMLSGDRHHDNVHNRRNRERADLERAREYDAPIIDIGDLHCLMQGKWDPRADQTQLRPEHRGNDYYDLVLNTAEEFYAPYADLFAVIGYGNHEMSFIRHHQADPIKGLARRLKPYATRPDTLNVGGYSGWVVFRFDSGKTQTIRLKYHHGYGGGGPVTKGVIQTNRRAVYLPDANLVATAHIHEAWHVTLKQERITQMNTVEQAVQHHISVPTYKDEYADGSGGFHIETGKPPKPIGCVWLEFSYHVDSKSSKRVTAEVSLDVI